MENPIVAYAVCFAVYKLVENAAMLKSGSLKNKMSRDASVWLIVVPYYLVLLTPVLEFAYLGATPGIWNYIPGGLLFLAATLVRGKAHLDLGRHFSMFLQERENRSFVESGLYRTIRHPLYLGNLLLYLACPVFLAGRFSWLVAAAGVVGIILRIRIEEKFLMENTEGYQDYMKRTRAMIPYIF